MEKIEKLINEILSSFKAYKGSWSMKRVLSFLTALNVFFIVDYCAMHDKPQPNEAVITLIGAYVTLAGADTFMSAFNKKGNNTNNNQNNED